MRLSTCPKCNAKVAQSDTICMDCGEDLIAASQDIVEQAKKEARGGGPAAPASPAAAVANPAAAGLVLPGESADEKRLRVFDRQESEKLRGQRPAMVVIIILAVAATAVAFALASNYLKQIGGMSGLKELSVAEFKKLGLNVFDDQRIMFVICAGLALGCFLCIIGEVRRLFGINAAISAVAAGETHNVVHLSAFTQIGLIIASFFAPPAGLTLGIIFKLSKDDDTRAVGSLMIYASLLSAAILIVNWIWSLASTSLQQHRPAPAGGRDDNTSWLWQRWA